MLLKRNNSATKVFEIEFKEENTLPFFFWSSKMLYTKFYTSSNVSLCMLVDVVKLQYVIPLKGHIVEEEQQLTMY